MNSAACCPRRREAVGVACRSCVTALRATFPQESCSLSVGRPSLGLELAAKSFRRPHDPESRLAAACLRLPGSPTVPSSERAFRIRSRRSIAITQCGARRSARFRSGSRPQSEVFGGCGPRLARTRSTGHRVKKMESRCDISVWKQFRLKSRQLTQKELPPAFASCQENKPPSIG